MMLTGCMGEAALHSLTPSQPRGLKRSGGAHSPFSSAENLVHLHAKVQASCVIQRAVRRRARRRRALREANDAPQCPPPSAHPASGAQDALRNAAHAPGKTGRASCAALGAAVLAALAAAVIPVATAAEGTSSEALASAVSALASAPAAAPASATADAAPTPDDIVEELDTVAAAEAAAAAEAGLQSAARGTRALFGANGSPGQLERAVLAVLFRALLAKVAAEEHLGEALSTDLGSHFAASLFLGTACGVLARSAAAWLAPPPGAAGGASPRLPPRRGALRGAPLLRGVLAGGGLARAFGVGAVQLLAFDALRAAEAAACADLPQDGGLLLAGALAGGVAAGASQPMDATAAAARNAARAALRGGDPANVTRALLALDVGAFLALEAACARLGLDPVPAL